MKKGSELLCASDPLTKQISKQSTGLLDVQWSGEAECLPVTRFCLKRGIVLCAASYLACRDTRKRLPGTSKQDRLYRWIAAREDVSRVQSASEHVGATVDTVVWSLLSFLIVTVKKNRPGAERRGDPTCCDIEKAEWPDAYPATQCICTVIVLIGRRVYQTLSRSRQ